VELYRSLAEIERTAVSIGSHDLILDVIADLMAAEKDSFLASTHVGSLGGLMALKRGECHLAPIHLLDEEKGDYNVSYLKRLFLSATLMEDTGKGSNAAALKSSICLIKGVGRVQGLIVAKGNPLNIRGLSDLIRCRYINRQRGAGTRILLDYRLRGEGLDPQSIEGYGREAATHMAVAAAVQGGSADAGMGISSAANALDLVFIPLGEEEYDFALPVRFLELPPVRAFIEILNSGVFKERLKSLGGYTWDRCGEQMIID
jgi:putative molybdopterin biosynthesis protein